MKFVNMGVIYGPFASFIIYILKIKPSSTLIDATKQKL